MTPYSGNSPWPDGVNATVDDDRKEAIIKSRIERATELDRILGEGAGADYLAAMGLTPDGRGTLVEGK